MNLDLREQFKDVPRETLEDLARLVTEQEQAYSSNRLEYYDPHNRGPDGGQLAFHQSDAKIRLLITGNRFGKTTCCMIEAIWLALGIHPFHPIPTPNRGKLYADSFPMVMENIMLKLHEWLPMKYLDPIKPFDFNNQGMLTGVNFRNGSIIRIGSYDQATRKAEGSNWHYVGFDEPPPRDLYVANLRGLVDFGGLLWISATPLSEAWMFDHLWMPGLNGEKAYIDCFRGTSHDNPHTDKDSLKIFLDELTPEERAIRELGEFAKLQGLVIKTYTPSLSDIDPFELDQEYAVYEAIDPHPNKPHAVLWKAIDRYGLRFVVRELSWDGSMASMGKEMARIRRELCKHGAVMKKSVADTSLNVKDMNLKINMLKELQNSLREAGETVLPKVVHKKDWLIPGINKLKDLYRPVKHLPEKAYENSNLTWEYDSAYNSYADDLFELFGEKPMPMEYVFNTCKKYRYELTHYQWPDGALDNAKPKAEHNEYIDCNRYIESVAPAYETPGSKIVRISNPGAYHRINNVIRPSNSNAYLRKGFGVRGKARRQYIHAS